MHHTAYDSNEEVGEDSVPPTLTYAVCGEIIKTIREIIKLFNDAFMCTSSQILLH